MVFGKAYRGERGRYSERAQSSGEHFQQRLFFDWLRYVDHPAAKLTTAIPNGAIGADREKRKFFAQEGVQKGFPDILCAWPKPHPTIPDVFIAPGAVFEAKWGENETSPEQKMWLKRLAEAGWNCYVCYSFRALKTAFNDHVYGDGETKPLLVGQDE
jgi:VRR-NUC domain